MPTTPHQDCPFLLQNANQRCHLLPGFRRFPSELESPDDIHANASGGLSSPRKSEALRSYHTVTLHNTAWDGQTYYSHAIFHALTGDSVVFCTTSHAPRRTDATQVNNPNQFPRLDVCKHHLTVTPDRFEYILAAMFIEASSWNRSLAA